MKQNELSVVVTSRSFSKHPALRKQLSANYSNVRYNDTGRQLEGDELLEFMKDSDAAIIGLEKINAEILSKLPDLKLISKYGVGLDNIDFSSVRRFPIQFAWKGGVNKRSVAELALSFMLLSVRKSFANNLELRAGTWKPSVGGQLTGKTVGIIGCGHIGKEVIRLLSPFSCKILVNDIVYDQTFCERWNVQQIGLNELIRNSDIASLHIPLNSVTRGIFNKERFELLKYGSVLVNTARGGLVDEAVLKEKLKSGVISAAFDVFADEPLKDQELTRLPNFFATSHIGGSSEDAILAMGQAALEGLQDALPIAEWIEQNAQVL